MRLTGLPTEITMGGVSHPLLGLDAQDLEEDAALMEREAFKLRTIYQ